MLEIEHAVQPLYRSDDSNDIDMVCVLLTRKRSTQQSGYSLVGGYNILLEKVICNYVRSRSPLSFGGPLDGRYLGTPSVLKFLSSLKGCCAVFF